MKVVAWILIPVILAVAGMVFYVSQSGGTFPMPRVLEANAGGQLLELPVISDGRSVSWSSDWQPLSAAAEQALSEQLGLLAEASNDVQLAVTVQVGQANSMAEQAAKQLASWLETHALGGLADASLPEQDARQGVILQANIRDAALAQRLLAAITPALAGKVALLYDGERTPGSMQILLLGTPQFNGQGQATFDPDITADD